MGVTLMYSWNVVFTAKEKAEVIREPVEPVGDDEVLCKTVKSLISIGTESTCLRGVFDPGTNWNDWVKYPFHPGVHCDAGREKRRRPEARRQGCLRLHAHAVPSSPRSRF
jgi:hypothetical protein